MTREHVPALHSVEWKGTWKEQNWVKAKKERDRLTSSGTKAFCFLLWVAAAELNV